MWDAIMIEAIVVMICIFMFVTYKQCGKRTMV